MPVDVRPPVIGAGLNVTALTPTSLGIVNVFSVNSGYAWESVAVRSTCSPGAPRKLDVNDPSVAVRPSESTLKCTEFTSPFALFCMPMNG